MAAFEIEGDELALVFSRMERLGGLRRGARVPLAQVESVEAVDDPWRVLEGLRVGTGVPGIIVLGTMVRRGPNDVVAIHKREPAVVVQLRPGAAYHRLIATVPDAGRVAAEISAKLAASTA